MDNLAHTLCGAALAKTRLGRASRLASWSLLVGANLPDADYVSRLFGGKAAYLVHHRGITHSLVGVVLQTLLLAAAIRALERRVWPQERLPWRSHLLPAFVGLASHPLLDLLNNYGVRPWLPFSTARYYGDLVFIVDPALWLLFGGIAALAGIRSVVGSATWAAIAAFTCWLVFTSERATPAIRLLVGGGIAAIALARVAGVGKRRPRVVLAAGALLTALYLGGLELAGRTAVARSERAASPSDGGARPPIVMRSPMLGDPFSWWVWRGNSERFFLERASTFGEPALARFVDRNLDDPLVVEAQRSPRADAWRYFARLPYGEVQWREDGRIIVTLADARYHTSRGPSWSSIEIELR